MHLKLSYFFPNLNSYDTKCIQNVRTIGTVQQNREQFRFRNRQCEIMTNSKYSEISTLLNSLSSAKCLQNRGYQ